MRSGRCAICGGHSDWLERDHRIPLSLGGPDAPSNIQLICPACHRRKSADEAKRYPVRQRRLIRANLAARRFAPIAARPRQRHPVLHGCATLLLLVFILLVVVAVAHQPEGTP